MRALLLPLLGWSLLTGSASAATVVVTNLGDAAGSCPSATDCTLRAAIAFAQSNDTLVFDPQLALPAILTLVSGELVVNKNLTIVGPGADRMTLRAAAANRVLGLTSGNLRIEAMTLDRGRVLGSNGPAGNAGSPGGAGQSGVPAEGGCIITSVGTQLVLDRVALRDCRALAGNGGNGGIGQDAFTAGDGGNGGTGGSARGGAILARGQVQLLASSISESAAVAGEGGTGGRGGDGNASDGNAGDGGTGGVARGGAIALIGTASLIARNSTLTDNVASGGDGGNGGLGGGTEGDGGNGGTGGAARGGQVYYEIAATAIDFDFATLGPSASSAGQGGLSGQGNPIGLAGANGSIDGELLFTSTNPNTRVHSSVFIGNFNAGDCEGTVSAIGANIDSDNSCTGFNLNANYAANFVGPGPIYEAGRAVVAPRAGAPAIDAAGDCLDLNAAAVTTDQSGRARPLDGNNDDTDVCDLGAIEFSFTVFRDGFED